MAYLQRLIVLLLLAFAGSAVAAIPQQAGWLTGGSPPFPTYPNGTPGASRWDADRTAGCVAQKTAYIAQYSITGVSSHSVPGDPSDNGCSFYTTMRSGIRVSFSSVALKQCPANSAASGGACQCATGYAELGGNSCVVDNGCMTLLGMTPPNDGACIGGVCQYSYKVNAGEQATAQPYGRFCSKSCTVKGNLDWCGQYSSGVMISGRGICQLSGSFYTGDKCNGSGEVNGPSSQGTDGGANPDPTKVKDEANAVPSQLPPGKCPVQVNGVDVVVSCGSSAENTKKQEDGSTKNPDGSVTNNTTNNTTTTTTICNGNSCQKITTVTSGGSGPNGTGSGSKTETKTESGTKSEMCAGSTAAACKGDDKKATGFGGSCVGGYKAVSEDAVVNAMAEETFRQNCKVNPDDGETTLAKVERVKTGNQTGDNPNNGSVSISSGSIDTSDALGAGGSCISDKSITVFGGQSVVLPLSKACDGFPLLGTLLVGLSFLVAGVIILRG
ncbi:virulence factor TspB C-terminal domain-related protein [Variovorax sp. GB1P17]|uniref:virulence factor TspB C-terminal domain-related protein n=1 Tax=Variovorax sp. GB1P17 TaxID=3443740 RepID=UPI003F47D7BB